MVAEASEARELGGTMRRAPRWVPDVALAALIIAAAFAPVPGDPYQRSSVLELVCVALVLPLLPVRRKHPPVTLAIAVVLFAVATVGGTLAANGTISLGSAMAVAVMVFAYTSRSNRRSGILVSIAVLVLIVVLSIPTALLNGFGPRDVQVALTTAFCAAAGDATRSRRQYIEAFTERARRAEETREAEAQRRVTEERLRIARDLHDAVAHQIAVISLNAGVASAAVEKSPEKAKDALLTIRAASRTVLGEIGDLLAMLRSGDDGPAASSAPQADLSRLPELIAEFTHSGLSVELRTEGDTDRVAGAAGMVAYRVVQEALTNAHKHGADARAHVLVSVADQELLLIVTNPTGGSSERPQDGAGMGLIGMRERVSSVRGTVEAGPAPGGWRVAAHIPIETEDPA